MAHRIRNGRYRSDGQDLQLPLTEPSGGNAIHGLVRWTSWQVVEASNSRGVLGASLWPQPGYPFHLHVLAQHALGEDGLEVTVTARNLDESAAPHGFGQHPCVTAGTAVVDQSVLTVPARTWLRTDERGLPVAAGPVGGTPCDLRTPQVVGTRRPDTPFADLDRNTGGPWYAWPIPPVRSVRARGSVREPTTCSSTPATPSRPGNAVTRSPSNR
ncbi:hypothetical protein ACFVH0_00670 [Streptomyces sp. NPDC127117]|uniref:aldose epimerase family protein n=1 Tax=Streptomyces sp. NPDC127117 TaxID=3345368 RepID=UPI003645E411